MTYRTDVGPRSRYIDLINDKYNDRLIAGLIDMMSLLVLQ